MKTLAVLALTIVGALMSANAIADAASPVSFTNARIFTPVKGSTVTAGYAQIKNDSDKPVEISAQACSAFKAVELHETMNHGGQMHMMKIESLKILPHASTELKPGGGHIMFFDAKKDLKLDEELQVDFKVDGKMQSVKFKVVKREE